MAPGCPDHIIADLAATHLSAIPCTAYATLSPDQIRFVARHSAAPVVVLGGESELARWRPGARRPPGPAPHRRHGRVRRSRTGDDRFHSFADVRARGREALAADPGAFEASWQEIKPDDPLSMIYTSGTTGDPKGVVLSHRNAIHQAYAVTELHHPPMHATNIAYLPLAHIAERELSIYLPIVWAGHVHTLADPSGVVGALGQVHPESFFGVPRVWEKMVAGLKNMLGGVPEDRRTALLQANELLQQGYKLRSAGQPVPEELAEKIKQTDEAALAPIRALLGLDKVLVASSGAAALPVEIIYFLAGLGIEICEVWGLSETTGAATSNSGEAFRAGTVGKPLADIEVKVAEDGELLVRGPIVFLGYLQEDGTIAGRHRRRRLVRDRRHRHDRRRRLRDDHRPQEGTDHHLERQEHRADADRGPAQGAPADRPGGRDRRRPAVRDGADRARRRDRPRLGRGERRRGAAEDLTELADHPAVRAELERAVESANSRLARIEQIKRYHVLPKTWTPESGELTPTLKLKRRVINDRYSTDIEALYAAARDPEPAAGS